MRNPLSLFAGINSPINGGNLPGSSTSNTTSTELQSLLGVFFGIVGGIAVLIIVIAGFQYITSSGDPQKAANARSAIIYALIGLSVAASAEAIVVFIVGKL